MDHGRRYIPSGRYQLSTDGNQNNVYDPKGVKWSRNEKKSNKYGYNKNLYQMIAPTLTLYARPIRAAVGTLFSIFGITRPSKNPTPPRPERQMLPLGFIRNLK